VQCIVHKYIFIYIYKHIILGYLVGYVYIVSDKVTETTMYNIGNGDACWARPRARIHYNVRGFDTFDTLTRVHLY